MPKFTQFVFFREYMNTILINKGFFSGEMHKIQFYSNRRNGHEDIPEEEFEDMMDMFDPNIALPDNLTFIDDTVLPQINPEGNRRDWGTGIAQKKFRVGSPTFFANGINIPGIILSFMHISKIYLANSLIQNPPGLMDDMDGFSCSDSEDEDFYGENGSKKHYIDDSVAEIEDVGRVRIEYRGRNLAEAKEDEEQAQSRYYLFRFHDFFPKFFRYHLISRLFTFYLC